MLETSVLDLRTEADRAILYEGLLALLDSDDPRRRCNAGSHLHHAFSSEIWEDSASDLTPPADRLSTSDRLAGILAAVERRLFDNPELLEEFCSHFAPSRMETPVRRQILDWLNRLETSADADRIPENALLGARILYGGYGATWKEAGEKLMAALDHDDLTVRACAAYQIGRFCGDVADNELDSEGWVRTPEPDPAITDGMGPLANYWALIHRKEIERSGVAGAFLHGAPSGSGNIAEWILTLVEQVEVEAYIPLFPCNVGFCAHEMFERNPEAVRRMMDAGRINLALETASNVDEPIAGMQPLLEELADHEDPRVVRVASWFLAYNYRFLHPNGERAGFVRRYSGLPDCDMFLLFR